MTEPRVVKTVMALSFVDAEGITDWNGPVLEYLEGITMGGIDSDFDNYEIMKVFPNPMREDSVIVMVRVGDDDE